SRQLGLDLYSPETLNNAPLSDLPAVFTLTPWRGRRSPHPPVNKPLLPLWRRPVLRWPEGARPEQKATPATTPPLQWAAAERAAAAGNATVSMLADLADAEALELWNRHPPSVYAQATADDLLKLLARFEGAALPGLLRFATEDLQTALPALSRVEAPGVAPWMARALRDRKRADALAARWLLRSPRIAAIGLIPSALCEDILMVRAANAALRLLMQHGHAIMVHNAAREYGVSKVLLERLQRDALTDVPARRPRMPSFWSSAVLPRPMLSDGRPLGLDAIDAIGEMLRFSPQTPGYVGLEQLRQACTAASLDAFAWMVFCRWEDAGAPPQHDWAMWAVAHLGGPRSARRLAARVRSWAHHNATARAARGASVLSWMDDHTAHLAVYALSDTPRAASLRSAAKDNLDLLATRKGHDTVDDLLDDLLCAKAEEADENTLHHAALRRFEHAMTHKRRWKTAVFWKMLANPTLFPLMRQLLWEAVRTDAPVERFRIDDTLRVPPDARIGIVHRLDLSREDAEIWRDVVGQQPFPQLTRRVFRPTAEETRSSTLERFAGSVVPVGKLMALLDQQWQWGPPDGARFLYLAKPAPKPFHQIRLVLYPGLQRTRPEDQTLGSILLIDKNHEQRPLGALAPEPFSEMLREIDQLVHG
ncbi:MAG: DUF4132 domain-containing protein, partial [Myxococcota bacterium]